MAPLVYLITGCSQGFGALFVSAVLARGDYVIATARNVSTLAFLKPSEHNSTHLYTLQLDVTSPVPSLQDSIAYALTIFGRIDVLINNAGYVLSGVWEELSPNDTMDQFATNFFGTMNLTRAILPHFRSRRQGTIVFMSSISAWLGAAAGGPYTATKFALEGAVECLEKEISPLGIKIHLIVLGQFRTNILSSGNRKMSRANRIPEYDNVIENTALRHEQTDGLQPGDPKLAVERILDVVKCEGAMQGRKDIPLRIPLGSDAVEIMRSECQKTLANIKDFEELSISTDFADKVSVPVYT